MKKIVCMVFLLIFSVCVTGAYAGQKNYSSTTKRGNTVYRSNTTETSGKYSTTYTTRTNVYDKGKYVGTETSRVTVKKKR